MSAEMMNKNLFFILFPAIILISSCDDQLSVEEAKSDPITNPQFVFMRESNLLYFAASYELEFEGESLTSSMVEWLGQGGTVQDTIWLNDQGNSGDIIYDDHVPLWEEAGIPAIDIIDFNYPNKYSNFWHTHEDIPIHCSAESLYQVGTLIINYVYER